MARSGAIESVYERSQLCWKAEWTLWERPQLAWVLIFWNKYADGSTHVICVHNLPFSVQYCLRNVASRDLAKEITQLIAGDEAKPSYYLFSRATVEVDSRDAASSALRKTQTIILYSGQEQSLQNEAYGNILPFVRTEWAPLGETCSEIDFRWPQDSNLILRQYPK